MKWDKIGEMNCSIARALSIIGDRWTMLIVRNAFLGTRRFADFQSQLGMTKHLLSERLKRLVEEGVFQKKEYQQGRFEYRFTGKGRALYPIVLAMAAWGDSWLDEGKGAPVQYVHNDCGKLMTPTVTCSECGVEVTARDVLPMPGPGWKTDAKSADGSA